MNKTSKTLQTEGLPLNNAVHLLKSLWGFVDSQGDRFDEFEKVGIELSGTSIYRNEQLRVRRRKKMFCEEMDISDTDDTERSFSAFLPIVDKLNSELSSRLEYESLSGKFGFLSKLTELTPDELCAAVSNLVMCYPDDLEQELGSGIVHFAALSKSLIDANFFHVTQTFETDIFLQLSENDLNDAFPNVIIMLKIYLCMFVANCEGERLFSKLKLILNYLRNSMGQTKSSSSAMLAIDNKLLRSLNFDSVINEFAKQKTRGKDF